MSEEETISAVESIIRHTEISGAEVFEKNFVKDGKILATVFAFSGSHAAELTAHVRQWCQENGMNRTK